MTKFIDMTNNDNVKDLAKEIEARAKKERREKRIEFLKIYGPTIIFVGALIGINIYLKRRGIGDKLYTYSYGPDCIWKIEATEKEVDAFNRYLKAFYEAQTRILEKTGKPWDPSNPLWMNVKSGDNKIYNRLANRLNEALKLIDQDKTPIEIAGDYLVMN